MPATNQPKCFEPFPSVQGDLGFFKLQRGVNALQLEAGDCW